MVNVYLQDLADEFLQELYGYTLREEIESILLDKRGSYKFKLTDADGTELRLFMEEVK